MLRIKGELKRIKFYNATFGLNYVENTELKYYFVSGVRYLK